MKYMIHYNCIFILILSLCCATLAQQNESGKEGEPAVIEKMPLSNKWLKALPDGEQPGLADRKSLQPSKSSAGLSDEKHLKLIPKGTNVYSPVWKGLEKFDLSEKENALLKLEVPSDLPSQVLQEVKNIEALWNSGNYEGAIENLRSLEKSGSQRNIAVGISWKVPKTIQNLAFGTDVRVGSRGDINKTCLDFDASTGNLFAALSYYEDPTYYWAVYISTDDGQTWQETYTWFSSQSIIDISCSVLYDYFYVSYADYIYPASGKMRRFYTSDGSSDATYADQTVFDLGSNIVDIAIATNADFYDNRIYYFAILADNSLVYYWADQEGLTWYESTIFVSDADHGLDACCNEGYADYFFILSYVDINDRLHVVRRGSGVTINTNLDDAGDKTSVTAYQDRIITAFEYNYLNGDGIKYWISYDGGDNWLWGTIAEPSPGQYFWSPDVAARKGGGIAVIYQEEVGEPDICWFTRRDYDVANWSSPEQFNEVDVSTGSPMCAEWIPPIPGSSYAYGTIWIGGVGNGAYFDRNDGGISVLYQGPETGSIAGGAVVNTDDFPLMPAPVTKEEFKIAPLRQIPLLPDPEDLPSPAAPAGANAVEDLSIQTDKLSFEIEMEKPDLLTNFAGIPDLGITIPPDPHTAAGPDHLLATVNSQFGIYDKSGTLLKLIDADAWYSSVLPGTSPCDPQIVFDQHSGRWIMIWIECGSAPISLLLSVSDDDNPLGIWYNWRIPGDQNGSTFTGFFNDYPKLGVDEDAIYVTANMFSSFFEYVRLRIIPKAQLLMGPGPVTWIDLWDLRDPDDLSETLFTTVPALTFGTPGVEYLINDSPYFTGTFMTLWSLTNPLGTPTLSAVNVPVAASNGWPSNADQLGGGTPLIDVGGRRVRNAVYRDGSVWTAHSVPGGTGDAFAFARYVRIDVNTQNAIEDVAFGADDFWYYYPAVTADYNSNLYMVFTRSGYTEYAGVRYTGREAVDPPGLQPSTLLKAGEDNYVKTFGTSRNRWGDYNGIAVDPADNNKVWLFAEYAAEEVGPGVNDDRWGTWFGQVTFTANYLTVTPPNQDVGPAAGQTTFTLVSNVNWTVSENCDWLIVTPMSGTGNGTLTVDYDENTSTSTRVCTITVSGNGLTQDVTVTQAGAIPNLTVTPPDQPVGSAAGQTTFTVVSNINWTVSESCDWLIVTPMSGSGDGTLTATYDENTSTSNRVCTITVSGDGLTQDVTVTQSGTIYLTVTPLNRDVGPAAGQTTFTLVSNVNWTVSENCDWLSVTPMSGTGNGTLTVDYDENTSTSDRVCTITVSGDGLSQDVTVIQGMDGELEHFEVVWEGNPYQAMNIFIFKATLDELDLQAGDEIGVFDGDLCVGASKLNNPVSVDNILEIITSADDGSGNGFTEGNPITFKIWDQSTSGQAGEYGATSQFLDCGSGDPIDPVPFVSLGEACSELDAQTLEYFDVVWEGNPYQPMNIFIFRATLYDLDLEAGDEIGVFDGDLCVGASKLTQSLSAPDNILSIIASLDDGSGNGFTEGNPIIFKVWDKSIGGPEGESGAVSQFLDCGNEDPIDPVPFQVLGTACAELDAPGTVTQTLPLNMGWNIFSLAVEPESSHDMLEVVQPLIDADNLVKVMDEGGNSIVYLLGSWYNYIGDWLPTEGYYINVNGDVNFDQTGLQIGIPLPIFLNTGWNIISYPCYESSQNALVVVQPLIDADRLVKVMDEQGNSIVYLLGAWYNYIGNMTSGEGYYVNVNDTITLDMTCGSSSSAAQLAKGPEKPKSQQFNLPIEGNPYKPMSIFITEARFDGEDLMMGDEIAVYDGDRCVGVSIVNDSLDQGKPLALITYQSDGGKKGFAEGNEISFRVWRKSAEQEYMIDKNAVTYLDPKSGDKISSVNFQGLGTAVVTLNVSSVQDMSSEGIIPKAYSLYQNYPNPFNPTTHISYDLPEDTEVRVEIYSVNGMLIRVFNPGTQAVGHHVWEWDGRNRDVIQMSSGVYFYKLSTKKFTDIKKMILIK